MNRDVCEHFVPADLPCDKCKPAALRLAGELESGRPVTGSAAAELRRLYKQNQTMIEALRGIESNTYDAMTAALVRVAFAKMEEA